MEDRATQSVTHDQPASPDHDRAQRIVDDFDLSKTLNSGQVFHWQPWRDGFAGTIGETPVFLRQQSNRLEYPRQHASIVETYLGLNDPIRTIEKTFPADSLMLPAMEFSRGIRIVRQPIFECLATFLTSALKQVSHIRAISLMIRHRYGRACRLGSFELSAFPRPEVLAEVSLEELLACRLGFRAGNVLAAARAVGAGQLDLEALRNAPSDAIREALCRLPGVGAKIANCVLLFGYGRLDIMPVDVWIGRVLEELKLPQAPRASPRESAELHQRYFGQYAGYAQQYLFHHWRITKRNKG